MIDLVERLRNLDKHHYLAASFTSIALCNEAADEIERLRKENEIMKAADYQALTKGEREGGET